MNLENLSVKQIEKVLHLKKSMATLEKKLSSLFGGGSGTSAKTTGPRKRRRKLSAAARAKIAAAQRARWARYKAGKKAGRK